MQRQLMDDAMSNKLKPLKPALNHVGLYMGLVVYTAIGALVITFKCLFCNINLIYIFGGVTFPYQMDAAPEYRTRA